MLSTRAHIPFAVLLALCALMSSGCSLTLDFGKFVPADGGAEAGANDAAAADGE